ncbi:O-methyltransferase [Egibacter rhizosphaerae]|uniref:O-methyltransferase n=1 Tax=Egibacter rhizosphaerae TaxID=1670831 RepID=A0A411YLP5_9ACTN|nr:O-methyltransferase [Egibacter rhizosphaerae]
MRGFTGGETEPLRAARARSEEADIPAVPLEVGTFLRFLAGVHPARGMVEIGSGGGYSGLWLLAGASPTAVLTTIEAEPDHQELARRAYAEAGVTARVRSILGPALQVLPRLADRNYDLVFLDALESEYPDYLAHARRLLRPGGLIVADNVLWEGRVADPAAEEPETLGLRALVDEIRDDPALHGEILPLGDGILVAAYHPDTEDDADAAVPPR